MLVTRHAEPAYVLLSIEAYERLAPSAPKASLLVLLAMSDCDMAHDDGEFDRMLPIR